MTTFSPDPSKRFAGKTKKVLIVDDSRAIRAWLRTVLSSDPRLEIAGEASSAVEARDFLRANAADVLTLDIEMPGMSGLEFLARLMRARPMPVVMLSSLTSAGSDAAVKALSGGAIDCILKPTDGYNEKLSRDICERVYQAACTRALRSFARSAPKDSGERASQPVRRGPSTAYHRNALFVIGSSTGGVTALEEVLPELDPQGPPVVIVQHMPGNFLESFSERLGRQLPQNIKLAEEGVPLQRGDVVLAPGIGRHTEVVRRSDGWYCIFVDDVDDSLHCPSVDNLFHSAVSGGKNVTAAILTGLGRDGAQGLLALKQAGSLTFGQDENSSVVYGMPRAAHSLGAVEHQLPLDKIGKKMREGRTNSTSTIGTSSEVAK
ncbi:MAG: chemotaxis-specific protein-glutamate methyltransferase CheB [Roseobacter sp.]